MAGSITCGVESLSYKALFTHCLLQEVVYIDRCVKSVVVFFNLPVSKKIFYRSNVLLLTKFSSSFYTKLRYW